jgi:hypothetical protein
MQAGEKHSNRSHGPASVQVNLSSEIYSNINQNLKKAKQLRLNDFIYICVYARPMTSRSSSYALATPPSIALHPLHNNQGSQLTIGNGTEVGEMFSVDGHHHQQQRRKSIQAQHLLGASSDCEESTMRLTPHNSELHLPDDTISTSTVSHQSIVCRLMPF